MPLRMKTLFALMMVSFFAVAAWPQEEAGDGEAAGASVAAETEEARLTPEELTPEEEEMLALREELGAQIEAGEIRRDEAMEIMEERAAALGLAQLREGRDDPSASGIDDDIDNEYI